MSKHYLYFFLSLCFFLESLFAQSIVDCRVVVNNTGACNPYGSKLILAKAVYPFEENPKLIITKTLPVPPKPALKVISVEDMIEEHLEVEDSLRFRGSKKRPFKVTVLDKSVSADELQEKIQALEEDIKILEKKIDKIESCTTPQPKPDQDDMAVYVVKKGDMLSKIAKKFGIAPKELASVNGLKGQSIICVGQELKLPFDKGTAEALAAAEYTIQQGDTLLSVAKKFGFAPKELADFNAIKSYTAIRVGKTLQLPLPHVLEAKKKAQEQIKKYTQQQKSQKLDMSKDFGTRTLRVTATAYTSHAAQTGGSPFVAAWGTRLRAGMKIIAVSNDMLRKYGMRNGTKVRIAGLPGYYTVRDKMSNRFKKRIDIYMGLDRRAALRWGRRSVVIHW